MSEPRKPGLICKRLAKTYPTRVGPVKALEDISFSAGEGEFVCIVGPSGCGKSTLLKIIAGLEWPSTGELIFRSGDPTGKPRNAMVFQEHGLFPWMSILDNVALGLEMQGMERKERHLHAENLLAQMGIASFGRNYPHELSVGMRQRAAIARAFLTDPQILLMDEPFSALDAQSRLVVQEELVRIWKDHQKMVIYVTHDIDEAVLLGDRVLIMSGHPGRIQEEIGIPMERPRTIKDLETPEAREITWHIWKAIEGEVRQSLRTLS